MNLYASWFVDRRCNINKVVQRRVRWETRQSNEHSMPKLQRVVLARLANKARNEKLAVGMGTCLQLLSRKLLSCGNLQQLLSLSMVHWCWCKQSNKYDGSCSLNHDGWLIEGFWPYREEVKGIMPAGNASECRWLRVIPTERPRGDYAQGYICLPYTSETVRTPCRISNQG